jgi:hypothetical protein
LKPPTNLSIISSDKWVGLKLLGVLIITTCNSASNLFANSTTFSKGFLISSEKSEAKTNLFTLKFVGLFDNKTGISDF